MDIPSYLIGAIKGAGSAGVKYVVVQTLPSTGEEGTIYLVPKSTSKTNNVYDEYMYISNNWELIGNTEADLSNYQTLLSTTNKLNADYIDDTNTTNKLTNATEKSTWNGKQDALVSGTNIKTINNESILGSGNLEISGGSSTYVLNISDILGNTTQYNTEDNRNVFQNIYDNFSNVKSNNIVLHDTTGRYNTINANNIFLSNNGNNLTVVFYIYRNTTQTGFGVNYNPYYRVQINGTFSDGVISSISIYKGEEYILNGYTYILGRNNTTEWTPTGNYNPSTKLYTDKTHYENMAGYDATKTQVLKNVNGTLTWVDE